MTKPLSECQNWLAFLGWRGPGKTYIAAVSLSPSAEVSFVSPGVWGTGRGEITRAGAGARFSKVPKSFRARKAITKI